jgi:hypothetical protein
VATLSHSTRLVKAHRSPAVATAADPLAGDFPDPTFESNIITVNIPPNIDPNSSRAKRAEAICAKLIPPGLPYSNHGAPGRLVDERPDRPVPRRLRRRRRRLQRNIVVHVDRHARRGDVLGHRYVARVRLHHDGAEHLRLVPRQLRQLRHLGRDNLIAISSAES